MASDRPVLGIALMAIFCLLAPLADSIAKILGDSIPLGQLLVARFAIQAILLLPLVPLTNRSMAMSPRVFRIALIRALLHLAGVAAMFTSLRYMPLADAVAIAFVMPFIMLVLGKFFLNEVVGPHRFGACVVGFIGTLLVIQPSFMKVGYAALLPLLVAVIFASFILVTRLIAKDIDPVSLQAANGIMGSVVLSGLFLLSAFMPVPGFTWANPTGQEWWLLIGIGIIGTAAHLIMTISLRFAPSVTLAPVQFLEIPLATMLGWLIFKDWPNGLAGVGILVICGAGLYSLHRERLSAAGRVSSA